MEAIKNLPPLERPREKLASLGVGALRDEELVAILLGSGTPKCRCIKFAKPCCKAMP